MLIEMKVSSLTVDPFTEMPIVVLRDIEGRRSIPIWIGLSEAPAIATELEKIALDRPATHDLLKNILGTCGVTVDRVEVHDLKRDTFYATIFLKRPGSSEVVAVDARPSDALAIALRTGAAIFVAQRVLEKSAKTKSRPELRDLPELPAEDVPALDTRSRAAAAKWKM